MRKLIWLPLAGFLIIGGAAAAAAAPSIVDGARTVFATPIHAATDILSSVLTDLVGSGVITQDQSDAISNAYDSAIEAKRTEMEQQHQAMLEQAQQLRDFLSDGVLTQDELDQLPADSPLQKLSGLMTDGQVTLDQLRELGIGLLGGFGPGHGHGGWMHLDWPQPSPTDGSSSSGN
jgi:hypothetical protein